VLDLPPATTVSLQFPPTVVRAAVAGTRPQALVELQACLADGSSCSSTRRRVVLVARPATDDPAHGHPGEGDPMPPIALVAPDGSVMTAPPANAAARVIFYSYDCAAMWPELEDQAWLASHAMLPRGAAPVLVSDGDPTEYDAGYYDRWRLSGLLRGYTDDASSWSSAVGAVDSAFGRVVYDDGFLLDEIPGSALHPTDYSVDASGTVVAVEKEYRAGFTLLP